MNYILLIAVIVGLTSCSNENETYLNKNNTKYKNELEEIGNQNYALICNEKHYHPVDIKIKQISDSLILLGIDSILMYRHWLGSNNFNGYGKVIWKKNNLYKQILILLDDAIQIKLLNDENINVEEVNPNIINFYYKNNMNNILSICMYKPKYLVDHDAFHFVCTRTYNVEECFELSATEIYYNPLNLRSRLVKMLSDSIDIVRSHD